jgi:hypothetical protein
MRSLILCLLWLSGCSSTAVRCDAHLRPINAPAAKVIPERAP